jgi:hypothetical protein
VTYSSNEAFSLKFLITTFSTKLHGVSSFEGLCIFVINSA